MSLPVLLPGSCCPRTGLASSMSNAASNSSPGGDPSQHRPRRTRGGLQGPPRCAASFGLCPPPPPPLSSRRRAGSGIMMPGRPLLSLGLLQLILGCCTVALSFGALSLSKSPQVRSSCPFWAGSSVILSGIIGLTTWKRPMVLLVNLFVMLSVVCVLLNLAGFILGCQGAQFVSSVPSCQLVEMNEGKICICCEESQSNKCTEKENVLKLFPVQSCNAVHLLLKKVFFALCALNALTTTVCLVAAALRYLQLLTARRPCADESQVSAEEAEEQDRVPDPEDFVPPAPPPSYFSTFYSCTPRIGQRVIGNEMIPLPHIYGSRFKGIEVFCPMEPPPPYEAVVGQSNSLETQGTTLQITDLVGAASNSDEHNMPATPEASTSCSIDILVEPGTSAQTDAATGSEANNCPQRKRSHSDPVIHDLPARGATPSCEVATQTERPALATVTLRRALRAKAARCRPRSLVDYKSYIDTKLLVARFLEEPSCSMTPDIRELVESIKTVLKSDEEHMDEAILSANFLDQVMIPNQQVTPAAQRLPCRRYPGLLHLESCGDVSTFCTAEAPKEVHRSRRTAGGRPHSLIGVVRETVL
ncbi:endosomal transmembrane epsin interactor 1 isoform X1 [Spea bombifrons]|uniref:endosomal transmembrane epsin interactor 1 isoform X1 n=1 Tax=Spea bombifrons TaxID=233779 RepID=UPI002348FFB1|nr:endosomal transmembrane epsin interactor 1 isoform X1 [Spea bombifrons]